MHRTLIRDFAHRAIIYRRFFSIRSSSSRCSVTGGYVYRGTHENFSEWNISVRRLLLGRNFYLERQSTHDVARYNAANIPSFGEDEDGELYVVGIGSSTNATGTVEKIVRAKASADFDGDFKTDLSIFRPAEGVWYINHSSNGTYRVQQFGLTGDVPTPEDFDGDNITDVGIFRPSTGEWYNYLSSNNTVGVVQFGANNDIPAAGDYDGDGRADFTVFRPSEGVWYILRSSNGSANIVQFGLNGDVPTAGDFDGDGKYDIGVWRESTGVWYRLNSSNNSFSVISFGLIG